jgi:glycosyltransferase involved in cell wall biosynthesis
MAASVFAPINPRTTAGRHADRTATLPITIYLSRLNGGGAEKMMVKLANQFAADGLGVTVIVSEGGGPLEQQLAPAVEVLSLNARHSLRATLRLARLLRRRRPPVILSALTYPNISAVLAARLAGGWTRVVISERNTTSHWLANRGWLRSALEKPLLRALYSRADAIVAVSEGVADDLRNLMRRKGPPIVVIYNPTIEERAEEAEAEPPDHPFLTEGGGPVVVAAGRLHRQKDFPTLIRAFARLRTIRNARLLLLGEGPERAALEQLVAELDLSDTVAMPGYAANPLAAFGRAQLFVLSSRFEGFPNVLVEALWTGVPVVSTDCPSGPREILEGGRYGSLVPVGDVAALADAMVEALDAPGDAAARTESARRFSTVVAAKRYAGILRHAVG